MNGYIAVLLLCVLPSVALAQLSEATCKQTLENYKRYECASEKPRVPPIYCKKFAENLKSCGIDPGTAGSPEPAAYSSDDFGGLQEAEKAAILDEAAQVKNQCSHHKRWSTLYKCECVANLFRDERVAAGPDASQQNIITGINSNPTCVNQEAIARDQAAKCALNGNEQYCACLGQHVAEGFAAKPAMNSRTISDLQMRAAKACANLYTATKVPVMVGAAETSSPPAVKIGEDGRTISGEARDCVVVSNAGRYKQIQNTCEQRIFLTVGVASDGRCGTVYPLDSNKSISGQDRPLPVHACFANDHDEYAANPGCRC